jgi:prophage tail gpP-like protein
MSKIVSLLVNDKLYSGWLTARVARSMDFLSSTFELSVTQAGEFILSDWQIKMGDSVKVKYGDSEVLTGYVEDLNVSYDDKSHTVSVAGRDKTGDLVDCPRPAEPKQWSNLSILQLVTILCSPFGVSVSVDSSATKEVARKEAIWSYNEGEVVFDAIKRLCLKQGLIPLSHGDGKLILTKLGTKFSVDNIERGVNVLTGGLRQSNKERFSEYHTKGFGFGIDTKQTKDYIQPKGDARDSVVGRYRPFVIMNDGAATFGNCKERATWESQLRAGNSRSFTYVLQGWEQTNEQLWKLNTRVKVKDKTFGVEDEFLINSLGFEVSDTGVFTAIGLVSKQKYEATNKLDLSKTKTSFDIGSILGGAK